MKFGNDETILRSLIFFQFWFSISNIIKANIFEPDADVFAQKKGCRQRQLNLALVFQPTQGFSGKVQVGGKFFLGYAVKQFGMLA